MSFFSARVSWLQSRASRKLLLQFPPFRILHICDQDQTLNRRIRLNLLNLQFPRYGLCQRLQSAWLIHSKHGDHRPPLLVPVVSAGVLCVQFGVSLLTGTLTGSPGQVEALQTCRQLNFHWADLKIPALSISRLLSMIRRANKSVEPEASSCLS